MARKRDIVGCVLNAHGLGESLAYAMDCAIEGDARCVTSNLHQAFVYLMEFKDSCDCDVTKVWNLLREAYDSAREGELEGVEDKIFSADIELHHIIINKLGIAKEQ